jgi:hypothetical protein
MQSVPALSKVAPLVEDRSAEILVNVMTFHIRRFVTQEAHASNLEDLFADDTVADEAAALSGTQREQFLVQRYSENLKRMAGFAYTSIAAIFRAAEDTVHYYLVFGTNSAHGVQVFKEAERVAFATGEALDTRLNPKNGSSVPDKESSTFLEKAFSHLLRSRAICVRSTGNRLAASWHCLFVRAVRSPMMTY